MHPIFLSLAQNIPATDTVGRIADGGTQGLLIALCVGIAALAAALIYVHKARDNDRNTHVVELLRIYKEQHDRERETGALTERLSAAVDTLESMRAEFTGRHNGRK